MMKSGVTKAREIGTAFLKLVFDGEVPDASMFQKPAGETCEACGGEMAVVTLKSGTQVLTCPHCTPSAKR